MLTNARAIKVLCAAELLWPALYTHHAQLPSLKRNAAKCLSPVNYISPDITESVAISMLNSSTTIRETQR